MSGELEIRGGGAIAVDTATLRTAAARFVAARCELEELAHRLGPLQMMLFAERDVAWEAASSAAVLSTRLASVIAEADGIAERLRAAAAVYELVELDAQYAAAVRAGDEGEIARLDGLRDALRAEHPDAAGQAVFFEFERAVMWPSELVRGATQLGYDAGSVWSEMAGAIGGVGLGGLVLWGATAAALGGQGRLARDARLTPTAQAVAVQRVASGSAAAPTSLAAAAGRMPEGAARVRVETYSMPDGSRQYAVYVAGMKDGSVSGGRDPWDNESNVQLWGGETSASYAATLEALDAAGARPGDVVHAFGHSQGAMIASHLALEAGYDTRTLVSFGSPVEADVGAGTLSVGIRHTDDLVAGLAGGGHAAPVGAAGSFVVERVAGASEGVMPAHGMASYAETAALVDASGDPRVDAVRATFAELGTAVSVEAVEYSAVRTDPVVSPASGGAGGSRRSS